MKSIAVTLALMAACQAMLLDPHISVNERDAASITIDLHREGGWLDEHVASVLMGYATRKQAQNRFGR